MTNASFISEGGSAVLQIRGLRKVYEGTVALGGVDLDIFPGEIHALLGENGAGKSTLVKLLAGIERSDGGVITIAGTELPHHHSPNDVAAAGVAFIHQQFGLVGDMTVAENIALAAGYPRKFGSIDWSQVREVAQNALARMGVEIDPDDMVASLPTSAQSVIAIARALAQEARLLVLDEPTASLTVEEVETLFTILERLKSEGVALIYISHRLDEVRRICDRVTVLRDGMKVALEKVSDITDNELVELIIGREPQAMVEIDSHSSEDYIVFENVGGERTRQISMTIRKGEVFGVAGLNGSGHHEIGTMLFGLSPVTTGHISVGGSAYQPVDIVDAIEHGFAYVPTDRNTEGAALELNLRENLFLNPAKKFLNRISGKDESRHSLDLLQRFDVRPANPDAIFSTLSGGNAQKVVLARWMNHQPTVIILNDPTAAVDIGARREIHQRLRTAAAEGAIVVLISSDMEEIEQVCDRAAVVRAGQISTILSRGDISVAALTRYAYESN